MTRQIARTRIVNRILDFNSGILKQLANVLKMFPSMPAFEFFLACYNFTGTALGLDLGLRGRAELVCNDCELLSQVTIAQNLE